MPQIPKSPIFKISWESWQKQKFCICLYKHKDFSTTTVEILAGTGTRFQTWPWPRSIHKPRTLCTSLWNNLPFSQSLESGHLHPQAFKNYPWFLQYRGVSYGMSLCHIALLSADFPQNDKENIILARDCVEETWHLFHLKFKFTASFCCSCFQTEEISVKWMQQFHQVSPQM